MQLERKNLKEEILDKETRKTQNNFLNTLQRFLPSNQMSTISTELFFLLRVDPHKITGYMFYNICKIAMYLKNKVYYEQLFHFF